MSSTGVRWVPRRRACRVCTGSYLSWAGLIVAVLMLGGCGGAPSPTPEVVSQTVTVEAAYVTVTAPAPSATPPPTLTQTLTPAATPSQTPAPTPTATPAHTPTPTNTPIPTPTHTATPAPSTRLTLSATTKKANVQTKIHWLVPVGGPVTIDWGDGATTLVPEGWAGGHHYHTYASAGSYQITIEPVQRIAALGLEMPELSGFNSSQLRDAPMTGNFEVLLLGDDVPSMIRSEDMVNWRPAYWHVALMPEGGTYNIQSAHMKDWALIGSWQLDNMPAGGTYSIRSADMVSWRPSMWRLYNMPGGTYTVDCTQMAAWNPTHWRVGKIPTTPTGLAPASFANWSNLLGFDISDNSLTQEDVDRILYGLYVASITPRAGGQRDSISVGGTNAAPSGGHQPAACPVGSTTPGQEVAHELLNDGCGAGFDAWSLVLFTGGPPGQQKRGRLPVTDGVGARERRGAPAVALGVSRTTGAR